MQKLTSTIGLLGMILYLLGLMNKSKSWSNSVMTIGSGLMAISIIIDCSVGFYDGFTGLPKRD